MPINIERANFDPRSGFQYYVAFKPNIDEEEDVRRRIPIEAALSISETGELADLTFVLPKQMRNDQALSFVRIHSDVVNYVPPRVFVAVPGLSGDTAVTAAASLDLDMAGRIVGMEIQWKPTEPSGTA
jgi:hypothetical protein